MAAVKKRKRKGKKKISDKTLLTRYQDPSRPGSLGGATRFAKANAISVKRAREILQRDLGYTLHKPRRRRFPTLPVVVFGMDEQWTADLIEVINIAKYNRGYRYLLTVVDVFSKYAWVEPVKSKTGKAVTEAMTKILKRSGGRRPINLQTDDGKEFYNKTFQALMKQKGIHHFSTSGDTKASVVERFNRTLKQRLYRYFTVKNTLNFVPVLQDLVQGYNRSYHRSIRMAPSQVSLANSVDVWETLYGKKGKIKKPSLKVKDRVRLNKKFRQFKKGYLPGWTEEVFVVKSVRLGKVPTYKVEEWDGTPVKGTFYEQDLQKVTMDDDALFRIEKIVKRKGNKVLVRWKGWPDKYDTWLEKADVLATTTTTKTKTKKKS